MPARIEQLKTLATPEKGAPWARRLGDLLLVIATILIAGSAAETTLHLLDPPTPKGLTRGPSASTTVTDRDSRTPQDDRIDQRSLRSVAEYHLFGRSPERGERKRRDIPTEAPETRLNLALKGILASGGEGRGAAIIDSGDGQKVYVAGADLPGNAILERVQNDRVILSRDGNFEMLRLDRNILEVNETSSLQVSTAGLKSSFVERGDGSRPLAELPDSTEITARSPAGNGATDHASATSGTNQTDADRSPTATFERSEINSLHSELRNNPSRITDLIDFRPVLSGGSIRGFRVRPRNQRAEEYFERAGLRANDLILAVNGVPASNHSELQNLAQEIDDTSQIRLRIERNGTEQNVVLRID